MLGQIAVREGKNGRSRIISMNGQLRETLERIPRRVDRIEDTEGNFISRPNPYVFASDRKPGQRLNDLPREWEGYVKQAGIENFHWHDLRHTFASRLVTNGVDLYTVSKLMGHQSLAMTQRYAHLAPDYLKSAVFALEKKGRTDTKTDTAEA
jgi:site-specific recombinase XerD